MSTQGLAGIAADLYGLPPAEFTAARNVRAARAKSEGDADLAAAVKRLAKPAVAAWVVNLMVRQSPARIGDLLELGEQLRSAQDEMDAATLRELTMQRRALTAAVASEGVRLAGELGQSVSASVREHVEGTLHAAMIDERAAAAVRSGLLLGPVQASGLDDLDLTGLLAIPDFDGAVPVGPDDLDAPTDLSARRASVKAKAAKEAAEAKTALAVAEAAAERTGKMLRAKKDKVRTLQAQVLQVRAELDELMRQVNALEDRLEPLTGELDTAHEACADAEAMDIAASAAVEKANHRLTRAKAAAKK